MNKIAKTIGMIALVTLLLVVPAGMVLAEIPNNPSNAADSLRQAEVERRPLLGEIERG